MGYYRMRIKHIKENRIYNHRLYEIKIQVFPEDEQKENFVVNGRHYYWMSISDMERDPNIVQIAIQNGHLCHVRRSVCDIIGGQPKTN